MINPFFCDVLLKVYENMFKKNDVKNYFKCERYYE